jgi:hypothetical protein
MNKDIISQEEIETYMRDCLMESIGIDQYEADFFMYKLKKDSEEYKREREREFEKRRTGGCKSVIFTFSLDNDMTPLDTVKKMYDILSTLRKKDYKFLDRTGIVTFEFYSGDGKWNPHIHIYNDLLLKPSHSAQRLHNFYVKNDKNRKKFSVYNVNARQGNSRYQLGYVLDHDKKDDKIENNKMDQEFRETYNIPDKFELYEV